jgi:phosphoglycolate phosphatase-like HAD superfamily hydrolase
MAKLVLFDIDGTLVLTGGAGIRAMNRAGESLLGVENMLDGIQVAGRTDWIILHDALGKLGRALDDDLFGSLREAYLANLRQEILHPGQGAKAVMPGVPALLAALHQRDDIILGLLTGNFEEGARIKLEHFDLWRYFRFGAFGDDAADRNALVPFARDRARGRGCGDVPYEDVIVIGDTPHDVACAVAVGAVPVAVATGSYTVDDLRSTGAPVVLADLSETDHVLRLLVESGSRRSKESPAQPAPSV